MKLHEMRKFIKEKWNDKFFVLEKNRVGHFVLYCEEHDRKWMVTKAKLLAGKGDCVMCRPNGPPKPKPMLPHSVYVDRIKALHPSFEVIGQYNGVMRNCTHRCKLCGFEWEATPNNVQKRYYKCPSCLNQGLKLTKQQKKAAETVVLDGRKERYEQIRKERKEDNVDTLEKSKLKEIEFRLDNGMEIPYYLKEIYRKHYGTHLEDLEPAEEDFDPEAPQEVEQPDAPDWDSDDTQDWTPMVRVKDTVSRVAALGVQKLNVQVVDINIVEDDEPAEVEELVSIQPDEVASQDVVLLGEGELELSDEDDDPDTYLAQRVKQCKGCLDMKRQPWRVDCEVCGKRR
jgi:hypothetical protein